MLLYPNCIVKSALLCESDNIVMYSSYYCRDIMLLILNQKTCKDCGSISPFSGDIEIDRN